MIKSYNCSIDDLLAFPGGSLLTFSIITCHLAKVEVSIIQKKWHSNCHLGGIISSVVLVPVWVNKELRFVVVLTYLLFMPPPPDVGPMRGNVYLGFNKMFSNCFNKIC